MPETLFMATRAFRPSRLGCLLATVCLIAAVADFCVADLNAESSPTPSTDLTRPIDPPVTVEPSPAAQVPASSASPSGTPAFNRSQNVTINLIHRLVQRGVL